MKILKFALDIKRKVTVSTVYHACVLCVEKYLSLSKKSKKANFTVWCQFLLNTKFNKLAKLRRHASRVHFANNSLDKYTSE